MKTNPSMKTIRRSANLLLNQRSFGAMALAGLLLCLSRPVSAGVVTVTMVENGGSITISMSGSVDFSTAGDTRTPNFFPYYIAPANGTVGFGASLASTQVWRLSDSNFAVQSASPVQTQSNVYFAPFGSGNYLPNAITGYTGSDLFVYTSAFALSSTYLSGGALSGTGTISGTFQTLGIDVGTSTTQFTLGTSANTLHVIRSQSSAVPDQMATASLGFGCALMGLMARRRRR